MVLYALGHNNQIASGSLARRCENDSLMSFLYSEIQLDGVWFDLPHTIWSFFLAEGL